MATRKRNLPVQYVFSIDRQFTPFSDTKRELQHRIKEYRARQEQLLNDLGIEFSSSYHGEVEKWDTIMDHHLVTLKNTETGKSFSIDYYCGVGHRMDNSKSYKVGSTNGIPTVYYVLPPNPLGVLGCIRSDDTRGESFEDWCWNFGYDTDSRKALDTYLQCQKNSDGFRRAFPHVTLDEYQPIEDY